MDTLITPTLTRRMFIFSTIMLIVAVALSVFNAAAVLSAPLLTTVTIPQTIGFEGFLAQSNGQPIANGTYTLTFRVYDVATGGTALWTEQQNTIQVTNGLYSVVLGATTAFTSSTFNGDRWVGVTVDSGSEISPRTRVSSVPFALNADNANKIGGGGTANMVVAFDGACPSGWTEFTTAQGRYIVGLPTNGQLGATVGTALSDQENRAVGQHNHTITDPGHSHGHIATGGSVAGGPGLMVNGPPGNPYNSNGLIISSTTGISINNSGSVSGTNAPYIQLRYCKLNS